MKKLIKNIGLMLAFVASTVSLNAVAAEKSLFDMKDPHAMIKNASEATFSRFRAEKILLIKI